MALLVLLLFGLGLYMVELSYYDTWYQDSLALHKSIGMLLLPLWLLRISWRLSNPSPQTHNDQARLLQITAHSVHIALYLTILGLIITGYLISTAGGRTLEVFDLLAIPALSWQPDQQEEMAGQFHEYIAWGLISLTVIHSLAALKHHFIDKDQTLINILKPPAKKTH